MGATLTVAVLLAMSWLLIVGLSTVTARSGAGCPPLLLDEPLDPEPLELAPLELAPLDPELVEPPELVDPPPLLVLPPVLAEPPEDEEPPLLSPLDPVPLPPVVPPVPPVVLPPEPGCHEPVGRLPLSPQARLRATSGSVRSRSGARECMVAHPCNWGTNLPRAENPAFTRSCESSRHRWWV